MNRRLSFIALALLLAACHHRRTPPQAQAPPQPDLPSVPQNLPAPPAPATLTDAEKKLDGALLLVARAARSGGGDAVGRQIVAVGIEQKDQKIKVEIVASTKDAVPELKSQIGKLGGKIDTDLENHVWAFVPVDAIDGLIQLNLVWSIAVSRAINTIK